MTSLTPNGAARFLSSPLYAATVVPMFVVVVFAAGKLSQAVDCYMIFMAFPPARPLLFGSCLAGEALAGLAVVSPVFVLVSIGLFRLERPGGRPGVLDHLRHCSILYAGLPLLGWLLVTSYDTQGQGLGWGLGAILFVVATNAILVNAVVLRVVRRHRKKRSSTPARRRGSS